MKYLTLKSRIILYSLLVVSVIQIISSLSFITLFSSAFEESKTNEIKNSIRQLSRTNQTILDSIENLTLSIISTPTVLKWIHYPYTTIINPNDLKDEVSSSLIFDTTSLSNYIDFVFLFADEKTTLKDSPICLFSRVELTLTTFAEFNKTYKNISSNEDTYFFYMDNQNNDIYVIRKVFDAAFKESMTFILKLNTTNISKTLNDFTEDISYHIIYDDIIFFSTEQEMIGEATLIDPDDYISTSTQNIKPLNKNNNSDLAYAIKFYDSDFTNYISISKNIITKAIIPILKDNIIISLFLMCLLCLMAFIFAYHLSSFLSDFLIHINRIRNRDYSSKLPSYKIDELNDLSSTMNNMVDEINILINKNYKSELLLKDADIHLLQSQISPHFLINTLTTISTKALLDKNTDIYSMASSLCNMIDSSLFNTRNDASFITVSKELECINCYLTLQKIRFSNFDYIINIDKPEILEYIIPRLSIEPIVENAFEHGVYNLIARGYIEISIYTKNDFLIFDITDNGGKYNQPNKKRNHGIGISNINKRLELLFDSSCNVTYYCQDNIKTVATCKIPISADKKMEEM